MRKLFENIFNSFLFTDREETGPLQLLVIDAFETKLQFDRLVTVTSVKGFEQSLVNESRIFCFGAGGKNIGNLDLRAVDVVLLGQTCVGSENGQALLPTLMALGIVVICIQDDNKQDYSCEYAGADIVCKRRHLPNRLGLLLRQAEQLLIKRRGSSNCL